MLQTSPNAAANCVAWLVLGMACNSAMHLPLFPCAYTSD